MRRMRAPGSAFLGLVTAAAASALAPSNGTAQDTGRAAAGGWTRTLAPSEIMMEARQAGFEPVSRPLQRGAVYVVVARDGGDTDVKLTIDAHSGRLLWVADISGTRYGGYYGYYGYPAWARRVRSPVPPADIPNIGPDRNNVKPYGTAASVRSSSLPRTRPGELTSAANKESVAPAQAAAAVSPAVPVSPDPAPAATPPAVTMVPIAPLE